MSRNERETNRAKFYIPGPVIALAIIGMALGIFATLFLWTAAFGSNPTIQTTGAIATIIVAGVSFGILTGALIVTRAVNSGNYWDDDEEESKETISSMLESHGVKPDDYWNCVDLMKRYLADDYQMDLTEIAQVKKWHQWGAESGLSNLVIQKWENTMHQKPDEAPSPKPSEKKPESADELTLEDINLDDGDDFEEFSFPEDEDEAAIEAELAETARLQEERANNRVLMEKYLRGEANISYNFYLVVIDWLDTDFEPELCQRVKERFEQQQKLENLTAEINKYLNGELPDAGSDFFEAVDEALLHYGLSKDLYQAVQEKCDADRAASREDWHPLEGDAPTLETLKETEKSLAPEPVIPEAGPTPVINSTPEIVAWYQEIAQKYPCLDPGTRVDSMGICYRHHAESIILRMGERDWIQLKSIVSGDREITDRTIISMQRVIADPLLACILPEGREIILNARRVIEERIRKELELWQMGDPIFPPQLSSIEPDEAGKTKPPIPVLEAIPRNGAKNKKNGGQGKQSKGKPKQNAVGSGKSNEQEYNALP